MHLQMDSDPLPEADTSLFDPGFLSGFGSSSSSYSQAYDAPPPYSLNPFGTMNDLVAPPSQSTPPPPLRTRHGSVFTGIYDGGV
ncbi:hypothetical protein BDQ17DRAFT_1413817, partial [Cyathus striatus]